MAEPSGLLNQSEQNLLRNAVTGVNTFNLGGMGLNIPSAVTTGVSAVLNSPLASNLGSLANITRGTYNENLASKVVNPNQNIFSSIAKSSLPSFISGKSSLDTMRERADMNRDGRVDNPEYNAYSYNFGKNLGVSPVSSTNLTPMGDRSTFNNAFENTKTIDLTTPKQNFSSLNNTPMGVGATGDLGGATGAGYKGSTGVFLGFGKSEGVGEKGPTGLGGSEQTSEQTSITDTTGNKDLSNTFSDDQAQSSDDSTFICSALYNMGDMKNYIYKYDKLYGRKVHPAIYRGYALWGKPLAKQIIKKGIVYKIVKPMALAWAYQMAFDLSKGKHGKNNKAIKITKTIGEGICYALGQIFKRRQLWLKSM